MKRLIFIFLFVFLIEAVLASSFSPSKLIFNLEPGEESCMKVDLNSDSEIINVTDKWAENKDVEWGVNSFKEEAEYHKLTIDYDHELLIDERELSVCISGKKEGEYHGILLLREELKGSSIIQMGIWMNVTIAEKTPGKKDRLTGAFINPLEEGGYKIIAPVLLLIIISTIFYKRKNGKKIL